MVKKVKFNLLSVIRTLQECAIYILDIGILVYLYDNTKSGFVVSGFYVSQLLPAGIVVFLGIIIDKYRKKILLSLCYFTISLFLGVLLWNKSVVMILAITIAMNFLFEFNKSTWDSLIPELVPQQELLHISSIINMIDSAAMIVAPLIAAAIVSKYSINLIIGICMALFTTAGILVLFLWSEDTNTKHMKKQMGRREPFQFKKIFMDQELRNITVCWSLFMLVIGVTSPMEIIMIEHVLREPSVYYGYGNTVEGLGMLGAAVLTVRFYKKLSPWFIIIIGFMIAGLSYVIIGLSPNIYIYMTGALLVGITASLAPMGFRVAVQKSKYDYATGRIFTSVRCLVLLARMSGTMITPVLLTVMPIQIIYIFVALLLWILGGGILKINPSKNEMRV